jgi:two-component system phosphate regulon sensor histidine kinase PhoR
VKKSFISGIILLLSVSLAAILTLQGLWIHNAWQTKQEDFDRSVRSALKNVSQKVEKREVASFINQRYTVSMGGKLLYQESQSLWMGSPAFFESNEPGRNPTPTGLLQQELKPDPAKNVISIVTDSDGVRYSMDHTGSFPVKELPVDSDKNDVLESRVRTKASQLNEVIYQMVKEWSSVRVPIDKRLPPEQLQQLVQEELGKEGITLPFQFAVLEGNHDSLCGVKSAMFNPSMVNASFRTNLFPNDIFFSPYQLLIHFSDMRPYLIKSLWWMLLLSIFFSLLIITTFASAIYIILKQKKVSEIKTDFINNMTHELKTPISTISVAIDAIHE